MLHESCIKIQSKVNGNSWQKMFYSFDPWPRDEPTKAASEKSNQNEQNDKTDSGSLVNNGPIAASFSLFLILRKATVQTEKTVILAGFELGLSE